MTKLDLIMLQIHTKLGLDGELTMSTWITMQMDTKQVILKVSNS